MIETPSGLLPDDESKDSWASEQLPMVVRRGLLERELKKMAARQGHGHQDRHAHEQPDRAQSTHPTAEAPAQDEHAG